MESLGIQSGGRNLKKQGKLEAYARDRSKGGFGEFWHGYGSVLGRLGTENYAKLEMTWKVFGVHFGMLSILGILLANPRESALKMPPWIAKVPKMAQDRLLQIQ